jgi:hypothetical protein
MRKFRAFGGLSIAAMIATLLPSAALAFQDTITNISSEWDGKLGFTAVYIDLSDGNRMLFTYRPNAINDADTKAVLGWHVGDTVSIEDESNNSCFMSQMVTNISSQGSACFVNGKTDE